MKNTLSLRKSLEPFPRRRLLAALSLSAILFALPHGVKAQESGGDSGGGGGGGGESGGHAGGGGGGGGGESGGHAGGSGESGGGAGKGKTPEQRAVRHQQRTGRTMGGGESGGGHGHTGAGSPGSGEAGQINTLAPDGSTTGPIGGENGGEHFIHEGLGGWGADSKVLRQP